MKKKGLVVPRLKREDGSCEGWKSRSEREEERWKLVRCNTCSVDVMYIL